MQKNVRKRTIRWSVVLPAGFALLCLLVFATLKLTETGTWTVWLGSDEKIATYKHFVFAKQEMNKYESTEPVYITNEAGKTVAIRYGVVDFNTKDEGQNTTFYSDGTEGYLNGASTGAGLYLDSNGEKVEFQVAGVTGWVDVDDVNLSFWYPTSSTPSYLCTQGSLVHTVSNAYGRNSYAIGPSPDFLSEGKTYWSFDGHWFWDDFHLMSQDVRAGKTENALNEEAWYNPYQFTPHRSLSSLTNDDYDSWMYKVKGIYETATVWPCPAWQSALFDQGTMFNEVQDETWTNAAMMMAVAMNESGYGQSQYAIENHNVFGHGAIDADPDQATSYEDLRACVTSHALDFLQKGYSNPDDWRWHGSWFGDKASGINVQYASDPYWGEKAASFLYQMGWPQAETISGKAERNMQVYSSQGGRLLYEYKKGQDYSFVLAGQMRDGWTPVWSEAPVQDDELNVNIPYTDKCIVWIRL